MVAPVQGEYTIWRVGGTVLAAQVQGEYTIWRRWHLLGVLASKTVVKNYSSIHRNFFPPTFSLVYLCIFLYTANVTPQPDKSPYTPYGLISLVSQAIWDSNDILILGNTRVRIMILTLNGNSDHISHA